MNPYNQLKRIAGFQGLPATFAKQNGTTFETRVKAESVADERLESSYPGVARVRTWSADSADFVSNGGADAFPSEGDRLIVYCRDGKARAFATAREASTSRYWNWRYSTPGGRILFYTKPTPAESR